MPEKLVEHTYGTHIYMKMRLADGTIEEIDVMLRNDGEYYETSVDHREGLKPEERKQLRQKIIDTFNELY